MHKMKVNTISAGIRKSTSQDGGELNTAGVEENEEEEAQCVSEDIITVNWQ